MSKHNNRRGLPKSPLMELKPATEAERDGLRAEYMTCEVLSRDFASAQARMREKRVKILMDRGISREEALANISPNQPLWDLDFMNTGRIRRASLAGIPAPPQHAKEKETDPVKPDAVKDKPAQPER